MIRGFLYWFVGSLFTTIWFISVLPVVALIRKRADFIHSNIRLWSKLLLRFLCMVDVEVEGEENINRGHNYIIISNHRSFTDILVGSAAIPIQFRWLAKRSLFRIPLVGTAMRMAGYIPVDREHSVSASRSLQRVKEALKRGISVWIFPEGTRTRMEKLGRFKRGAFLVAIESGKPILPVTLIDTDNIFYRPFIIKGKRVKVVIGKPLDPDSFDKEGKTVHEITDYLVSSVKHIIQTEYDANVTGFAG
ncbi:MAG: lysophospholipid acyltransferase family protein [Spirochaetota bacterium]